MSQKGKMGWAGKRCDLSCPGTRPDPALIEQGWFVAIRK